MAYDCSNLDCNVGSTGVCIDAFTPVLGCPNIIDNESVSESEVDDRETVEVAEVEHFEVSTPEKPADIRINVAAGTVLPLIEATNLLRKYNSKVIACVGPSDVGKTTLLASIYEYFNNTIVKPYAFAGSKTLYSFEQICHLSRSASGAISPDTLRTPTTGLASFYHLAFDKSGIRKDILFADRAGEEYTAILDDSSTCADLYEIKRSDVLLLLVDSSQLAGTDRHAAKRNTRKLIELLNAENMLLKGLKLVIVMTRYDKVEIETRKTADSTFKAIHSDITQLLSAKGIVVDKHIVAARPDNEEEFDAGYGVKELLSIILEPVIQTETPTVHSNSICSSRIFNQLKGFS